jgi:energy-coupling factor transport system permease protein
LELPQPTDYQYVVFHFRWITITRRSLDVGIRVSSLLFTLVYSCNLYLLTTAPEEITTALEKLLAPLRRFNVPVTEIILSLTLALRFIPLVLEEIQNLVRSVRTRAINWQKLGLKNGFQLWLLIAEKLLENLLTRAQQIAIAMEVRGFTSPDRHLVQWYKLKITWKDWVVLAMLCPFWLCRFLIGSR